MIDLKTFRKVKELQSMGVSTERIQHDVGISKMQYYKWCKLDEETFIKHLKSRHIYDIDNYRDFILSIISITPQVCNTVILERIVEKFPDFEIPKTTFFRLVEKLRDETGYVKKEKRYYKLRSEVLPGLEAQSDFGQMKMKNMYGRNVTIYFFVMELIYSRMKFAYFSRDPFTTDTAIDAHEYAFKFFGGKPQSIVYDQDKIYVVSEKFGDFTLTKKFEEYVKDRGFTARFCMKYDPESKAFAESTIWTIKHKFLEGRIYTGIDPLNNECLEWLDRFANGDFHAITKKIPKEMFIEEYKHLTKVEPFRKVNTYIVQVRKLNQVHFRGNIYQLPTHLKIIGSRVKLVVNGDKLEIYRPLSDELICTHDIPVGQGRIRTLVGEGDDELSTFKFQVHKFFKDSDTLKEYEHLAKRQGDPRYIKSQYRRLARLTRFYNLSELTDAMKYCIKVNKCSVHELSSYFVYKLGVDRARVYCHTKELAVYTKRAKFIKEDLDGRH